MDNTYIADIHSHILPGVDDGAKDPETSARLLSKAYEEGTRILFFTPHYQRGRNKYKPQNLDALYNARDIEAQNQARTEINAILYRMEEFKNAQPKS